MKLQKSLRRSVSPFGASEPEPDPFASLKESFTGEYSQIPVLYEKAWNAAAGSAADLAALNELILKVRTGLEETELWAEVVAHMNRLFDRKTELFLVDHYDKDHCEKMGWAGGFRDVVLFAKERDDLISRFFGPAFESEPAELAAFMDRWTATVDLDRGLHLLDFLSGSKNPTLDHHLLFSHPAVARVLREKKTLRAHLENAGAALSKLNSPTWENTVREALGL